MNKKPQERNWHQSLLSLLDVLFSLGDVLMLISQTVIVSLGVPLVLVLAVIVEQQRVKHGIDLFEVDSNLASLGSWVLVIINLVFGFQAHHIEQRTGYKSVEATEFSLRIAIGNLSYWFGMGKQWEARMQSPAKRYYQVGRIVTVAILALALAGSMKTQLQQQSGAWYEGLISVATQSTLSDIATWLGGLLFAFAAVMSAQASSRYIASRVVEIRNQTRYRKQSERPIIVQERVRLSVHSGRQPDGRGQATGHGYSKKSDARTLIRTHLEEHPADTNVSVRDLAKRLNVGKSTVAEVMSEYRAERISTNGNGHNQE